MSIDISLPDTRIKILTFKEQVLLYSRPLKQSFIQLIIECSIFFLNWALPYNVGRIARPIDSMLLNG